MSNLLLMYERMRQAGGLVPSSKAADFRPDAPWQSYDFPTAVDYCGYIKKRDGSHRRMIAAYLGLTHLPTLVLDFAALGAVDLAGALPYLREQFAWFRECVWAARQRISQVPFPQRAPAAAG